VTRVTRFFVGLDLAWGENRPTGVAVVDGSGELLHVSTHDDDAAITAALAPYVEGECLVAVDAPLIVTNATGNRPAEAALNKVFARFDAGAHPANTGKKEFAEIPRGARLAAALGLDIDPSSTAPRRAIEVYPHPATVALFGLGRTLKYKNKSGRTLERLRSELLVLMDHLEALDGAAVPLRVRDSRAWLSLRALVEAAERKSDLRKVEDQVDAVVCAYVALFSERRPDLTTVYGDGQTGYIVTPTLPEGHQPSRRTTGSVAPPAVAPAAASDPARDAVRRYAELQPELQTATETFVSLVQTLLDDAGINYLSVTGRAKSVASFAAKAERTSGGRRLYSDPLEEITDQIGLRVITYLHSDVAAVAELLGDQMVVLDDRDWGQETASEGRFGYASRHLLVSVEPARAGTALEPLRGRHAQVQVRTVLQHAWAEFEHAIRYKGTIPEEHAPDLDRRFTLAAGLLELADREFSEIRDRLQAALPDRPVDGASEDPRISAQELAAFLAGRYVEAGWSRPDHYQWVAGLLLELGITSLDELGGLLASVDHAAIDERMGYKYPAGAVRRLDDALLDLFGTRYVQLHGNAHRVPLLEARLAKLRSTS
jgi:predicted RNase H-like nuclease/ppGpp synthetase/RelA/SpoT-type nucleotidyltranferase